MDARNRAAPPVSPALHAQLKAAMTETLEERAQAERDRLLQRAPAWMRGVWWVTLLIVWLALVIVDDIGLSLFGGIPLLGGLVMALTAIEAAAFALLLGLLVRESGYLAADRRSWLPELNGKVEANGGSALGAAGLVEGAHLLLTGVAWAAYFAVAMFVR